jgi:putative selenium metabolism hydrolase
MKPNSIYAGIAARAAALGPRAAEDLCDMIRVPSFSTKEREVVALIAAKMRDAGFDEVRVDGLGSAIGRIGDGPRVIAFDAHIDTVYPGERGNWSFDPFDARIVGGKVWGRGAVDQEGGMASMLAAGRIIREFDLARGLTVLFTGTVMEEDCDGLCWRYLIEQEKLAPELVVITEPTNLGIYRGHRGRMEMTVELRGVSCHGSAPERGVNAIYEMARVALEIERLNERLARDPFLGKGTVTISEMVTGSPSQCAVADYARIYLDRRLTAGETREIAVAEVRDAAARAGCPDAEVKVPIYAEPAYTGLVYPMDKYYPTWTIEEGSPWLEHAVAAYAAALGETPRVDKWTFSTNGVAIRGIHGIPCIGMGPGDEVLAHAPDEACPVDHLWKAAAFYAALVARLGGAG